MTPGLLSLFLERFFEMLYTRLAWGYDAVSWIASMGQWNAWVTAALVGIPCDNLLEIGHGTGHLISHLQSGAHRSWAIDPSIQMSRITRKRLLSSGLRVNICRAVAQALPFPSNQFSTVVATFPSRYIFDRRTIFEVARVLKQGGMIVIVLYARITSASVLDRLAKWLFDVTGQSGDAASTDFRPWEEAGFSVKLEEISLGRADVVRVTAQKVTP
jgi:ubiquinone/menaquinone biosynthesis C-methylase UbiE